MKIKDSLIDKFKNPTVESRSVPFWSWNDNLSIEELERQAKDMKEKGMGGFIMHSRDGLETEYMGPDWMNCVKAAVKTAKENGMAAWIYDEDKWPAGHAGGLVHKKGGDKTRSKILSMEIVSDSFTGNDSVLAVFKAIIENDSIFECTRLNLNQRCVPTGNEVLLVFRREICPANEWYGNDTSPDNLNPDSVATFIETTHEVYKKVIGEEFGKAIPGVFTDEPCIDIFLQGIPFKQPRIPWTDGLIEYFREKRGYDLLDIVPFIFFKCEKSFKARHDYWRTISERFCESYTKQLGEWCGRNNLVLAGHFQTEGVLGYATQLTGSIMPNFRYMQIPGIDILAEQTDEYLTVKQCTSVANQYGKKYAISEMYGCTGWDFTYEGQKWIGDWQYAMGINLRCQHLVLYSLKGCRKRDFPPSFNYNNPCWKHNNLMEDYFARLSAVMAEGETVRDVLVIHPQSTAWSMLGTDPYKYMALQDPSIVKVNEYGEKFNSFIKYLLAQHYDFDLGDELIIEEKGRIEEGRFFVNVAGYSVVVIPQVSTLLGSTVKLLKQFLAAGGKVVAVGPLPDRIDGEYNTEIKTLFINDNLLTARDFDEVTGLLEKLLPRKVSIRNMNLNEAPELLYLFKNLEDGHTLFIANNDRNASHEVVVTLDCLGKVEEWDPMTGDIREIEVEPDSEKMKFNCTFGPSGSKLFVIFKNQRPRIKEVCSQSPCKSADAGHQTVLSTSCRFTRTLPNALVLDKCLYRIMDGSWSEEADVWQAQRSVRETLGMKQVFSNGILQRYKWINKPHPNDGTPVQFKFMYFVEDVPEKDVYLVVEDSNEYGIFSNGANIGNSPDGWFIDRHFNKVRIPNMKKGMNEIILSCGYTNRIEVEECYIIGGFSVDTKRVIVKEPAALNLGDWCFQGYYHYCGSIVYHFVYQLEGNRNANDKFVLELGEYYATIADIRINGAKAGCFLHRNTNTLDITSFLKEGINDVDIEVAGSLRNLLGPLHDKRDNKFVRPAIFRTEGIDYTCDYFVKPYGLMSPVKITLISQLATASCEIG